MISKKEPARYCEKGERRIFAGLHSAQATSDKATAIMSSHCARCETLRNQFRAGPCCCGARATHLHVQVCNTHQSTHTIQHLPSLSTGARYARNTQTQQTRNTNAPRPVVQQVSHSPPRRFINFFKKANDIS